MKTLTTLSLILFVSSFSAYADRDDHANRIPRFKARDAYSCSDIQVENVVDWFRGKEQINELDEKIGVPYNQGSVGWCFAYTVRDILHHTTNIKPDLGLVARDYYTGLTGKISSFFGGNEGGYNYSTLNRSIKNGLCPDGGANKSPTVENIKALRCESPRINLSSFGRAIKTLGKGIGNGHTLFHALDNSLERNLLPGISYNADGLSKEKYRTSGFFKKRMANHASTVAGRYFDHASNECRYIIRNSWGTYYNYTLKGPQKDGYHTITEKDLAQSLYDVTIFADRRY